MAKFTCSECKGPGIGGEFGYGMLRPGVDAHDTENPDYIVCYTCWKKLGGGKPRDDML